MNEFSAILCHARRFKGSVKELSIEQLEDVKLKLDKIIKEVQKRHNFIEVSKFDEVA